MKHKLLSLIIIIPFTLLFGQKEILNEDIFLKRKFSQDWVYGLNSMNNGIHYSTLERGDTVKINKYSYEKNLGN